MNTTLQHADPVPSDVLAGILAHLGVDKFTGDSEVIHTILARAKRHYSVLNVYNFTSGNLYPFSRELEEALSILQRSRMIRMENPDYDTYVIPPTGKRLAEQIFAMFAADDQRQLRELAEIFASQCGKNLYAPVDDRDTEEEAHS
ncbi:MAG TPA: hypothetical protein VEI08_01835 [Candidatus Bathyarchaeia archaeon]|nr:hypothetical protein [Candidatus Bathyarchaeia archaeon]